MHKLKLDVSELEVTSFDAEAARPGQLGTVAGRAAGTTGGSCGGESCNGGETCEYFSCIASCLDSCGAMCYSAPATNCEFCYGSQDAAC